MNSTGYHPILHVIVGNKGRFRLSYPSQLLIIIISHRLKGGHCSKSDEVQLLS